eukprot:363083-Chlamydomonas_euryale.AAC.7
MTGQEQSVGRRKEGRSEAWKKRGREGTGSQGLKGRGREGAGKGERGDGGISSSWAANQSSCDAGCAVDWLLVGRLAGQDDRLAGGLSAEFGDAMPWARSLHPTQ